MQSASDSTSAMLDVIVIMGGSNGRSSEPGFSHCFSNLRRRNEGGSVHNIDNDNGITTQHQHTHTRQRSTNLFCCCLFGKKELVSPMLARCGGGEPGNITTAVRSRVGLGCWMISSGMTRSRGRWARSRSGVGGWTSIEMEIRGGVGLRLLLEPELLVVLSLEKLVGVGESVSDSGWLISIVTWWFSLLGF